MSKNFQRLPESLRILVRSTNWLGDAVMSTPALARLREKFPAAHIAIFTNDKLRELWLHHPTVNEVISFNGGQNIFSVLGRVRREKFDIALVFPNSPRSAMEMWGAGIPQRIGYARPWRRLFLTHVIPTRPGHVEMHKRSAEEIKELVSHSTKRPLPQIQKYLGHQTHEYLQLVSVLGAKGEPMAPRLYVIGDEIEAVKKKFNLGGMAKPIFGLNPGAEYGPAKRWPVERFVGSAREIQQRTGCVWILFGGKGDMELTRQIEAGIAGAPGTVLNLAGKTSLRELMALLSLCQVLLSNDTGPTHVAAALGVPVVVPFGSTAAELTGPGVPGDAFHHLIQSDAPCAPCFLRECPIDFRCMKSITVEDVVKAVCPA